MRAHIVDIGNSKGIRLPQVILKQTGLGSEVEMVASEGKLVIHSLERPRMGWEESFKKMAQYGEDHLLDGKISTATAWERKHWKW